MRDHRLTGPANPVPRVVLRANLHGISPVRDKQLLSFGAPFQAPSAFEISGIDGFGPRGGERPVRAVNSDITFAHAAPPDVRSPECSGSQPS